ncbi:uncharacterized protein J8A68_002870 [[Candida] subhashii]|uniref:Uncharacterized protein n=1 Tax=[Candida] subhashii TaxID=561895 RepID=A0A8J5QFQ4_9ASCO|nr:uncharacterized protein J8A68_002870 [[Candida] subhashii]KAG7663621.1 hypothetical protein J8A68_002870 [[Candida] subhashii]
MDALIVKLTSTDITNRSIDDNFDDLLGIDKNEENQSDDTAYNAAKDFGSFFNEVTSKEEKKPTAESDKPKFRLHKQEDENF